MEKKIKENYILHHIFLGWFQIKSYNFKSFKLNHEVYDGCKNKPYSFVSFKLNTGLLKSNHFKLWFFWAWFGGLIVGFKDLIVFFTFIPFFLVEKIITDKKLGPACCVAFIHWSSFKLWILELLYKEYYSILN